MSFALITVVLDREESGRLSNTTSFPTSRRVFINGSSINLEQIEPYKGQLAHKILFIVDGTISSCSEERIDLNFMPAGTFNSVRNMIYNGTLAIRHKFLVLHLGSSQVLENTRKATIGQILDLVAVIKAFVPDICIAFSGVIPRPVDHAQTGRAVVEYNHAIHTAVNVASRRYQNVKYFPHHHQFTNTDGDFISRLYHKQQLRVSKKGAAIIVQNILKIIMLG